MVGKGGAWEKGENSGLLSARGASACKIKKTPEAGACGPQKNVCPWKKIKTTTTTTEGGGRRKSSRGGRRGRKRDRRREKARKKEKPSGKKEENRGETGRFLPPGKRKLVRGRAPSKRKICLCLKKRRKATSNREGSLAPNWEESKGG